MQHRLLITAAIALAGCQSARPVAAALRPIVATTALSESPHHGLSHPSGDSLPVGQLKLVKRATARYRDIKKAIADGYADINVVLPNMGRHFMKSSLLDSVFEVGAPELLVYSDHEGHMELVSVEYAVPLNLSATAPEGFRGTADEWFANQQFQLWTLHAWVWKQNPDGVFNPTNRLVP